MNHAEVAAAAAPWWGVPLVAGILAILGVMVGQAVTWSLDQRRARREEDQRRHAERREDEQRRYAERREDERRWHSERRQTYAAYIAAIDDARLTLFVEWNSNFERDAVYHIVRTVSVKRFEVALIASTRVRHAADTARDAVSTMISERGKPTRDKITREASSDKVWATVDSFIRAAQAELSIDPQGKTPS